MMEQKKTGKRNKPRIKETIEYINQKVPKHYENAKVDGNHDSNERIRETFIAITIVIINRVGKDSRYEVNDKMIGIRGVET